MSRRKRCGSEPVLLDALTPRAKRPSVSVSRSESSESSSASRTRSVQTVPSQYRNSWRQVESPSQPSGDNGLTTWTCAPRLTRRSEDAELSAAATIAPATTSNNASWTSSRGTVVAPTPFVVSPTRPPRDVPTVRSRRRSGCVRRLLPRTSRRPRDGRRDVRGKSRRTQPDLRLLRTVGTSRGGRVGDTTNGVGATTVPREDVHEALFDVVAGAIVAAALNSASSLRLVSRGAQVQVVRPLSPEGWLGAVSY